MELLDFWEVVSVVCCSSQFWTDSKLSGSLDQTTTTITHEETLDQIHKERKWKAAAEELKPKLKARVLKIPC